MLNRLSSGDSSESNSEDTQNNDEEDSTDELSRAEKAGQLTRGLPETYRILRSEWEEEQAQFYFLLYSAAAAFAMLYSILYGRQIILYGIFAFYAITAVPLLYLYEEERYFKQEDNPFFEQED